MHSSMQFQMENIFIDLVYPSNHACKILATLAKWILSIAKIEVPLFRLVFYGFCMVVPYKKMRSR